MSRKHLVWILTVFLVLTVVLAACDLPEVTPPPTEAPPPTATETDQVTLPLPSATVEVTAVVTTPIKANSAENLAITQRVAVSNIQGITWSEDSDTLALITQNRDAADNQVYGVTLLNAADLSNRSIYSSTGNRISAVASDGKTAAVISRDMNAFSLVDTSVSDGTPRSRITDYLIGNVTFSPEGRYAAVTKAEFWEVILYDFNTLDEVRILAGFETASPVFNAGFNNSPQWLVWHARGTLQLQEVETGMLSGTFQHEDFVSDYAVSPDGTILASSAAKTINNEFLPVIMLWDTSTSTELSTLVISDPVTALQFSPDGKLLAVAAGNSLQLWDVASGTMLTTLGGHTDIILELAFSPDQHTIASAGLDNQLYLWQIIE